MSVQLAVAVFAIFASVITVSLHATTVSAAETKRGEWGSAIREYQSGQIDAAIKHLIDVSSSADVELIDRINARLYLANICSEIVDYKCLAENNTALDSLIASETDPTLHRTAQLQTAVSEVEALVWNGNQQKLDLKQIISNLNRTPFGQFYPENYLTLQVAEIDLAFLNGQNEDARTAIARLIARAAVLPNDDYMLPSYLADIVIGLYESGDRFHALLYAGKFDSFIRLALPKASPLLIRYLELTAELEANIGSSAALEEGLKRLDAADDALARIHGDVEQVETAQSVNNYQRAELYYLKGDNERAAQVLAKSPIEARRREIQAAGHFGSEAEFNFALIDLFFSRAQQHPVDTGWLPLLSEKPYWETGHKLDEYFELERNFGLALLAAPQDPGLAHSLGEKAAFADVKRFEESLFATTRSFPLPNFVDRIILGTELGVLSNQTRVSSDEMNFIVKATTILQRNILHFRGDTLFLLASLGTEKERRIAQSWLLLSDRRDELEIQTLQHRVTRAFEIAQKGLAQTDPRGVPKEFDDARAGLDDLGRQIDDLRLSTGNFAGHVTSLPDASMLAAMLRPEERIVVEAPFNGMAFRLCIGPNDFVFNAMSVPRSMLQDAGVLRDALVATYAPQPVLDSQYPAEAAVRVGQLAFGGFGSCLKAGNRIFYSPILDFAAVPPGALLETVPTKAGAGYALADAPWLIEKYDFANISSVEEFAAARELSAVAGAELPFLGIGDPVLNRPINGQSTGGEVLARRGVRAANGTIASLPELPDTGVELRAVAAGIVGAQLLLRDDASRTRFMTEPLGHFNTIEFATHGLITGDLTGVTEPGLVLTPTKASDREPADDGFLSSTEISRLTLKARLVVLSACNSANFEVDKFYGSVRGLTESFAVSGVPTVVGSLWPVDSATSEKLISTFFAQLGSGSKLTVSGALAAATREFLHSVPNSSYLHPRFWAPFVAFGDGGETLAAGRGHEGPRLVKFDVGEGAGEVLGITRPPGSANIFDSRIGDWSGKRYASIVEMRDPSGRGWQAKDAKIGAGEIVSTASQLFVAGYTSSADGSRDTPVLRSFDLTGKLLWERQLSDGATREFIADLEPSQDGGVLALTRSDFVEGQPKPAATLAVESFRPDGRTLAKSEFAVNNAGAWRLPKFAVQGKRVFVFSPVAGQLNSSVTDDYGQIRGCATGEGTQLFELADVGNQPLPRGFVAGVVVLRAKALNGKIFVGGIRLQQCSSLGEAYLGELDEASWSTSSGATDAQERPLRELYVEKGLLGGEILNFAAQGASLILEGNTVTRIKEMTFERPAGFLPSGQLNASEYQREDSFLIEFDPSRGSGSQPIHFINAGVDAAIEDIDLSNGQVTLAGDVGFRPLWAQYVFH